MFLIEKDRILNLSLAAEVRRTANVIDVCFLGGETANVRFHYTKACQQTFDAITTAMIEKHPAVVIADDPQQPTKN